MLIVKDIDTYIGKKRIIKNISFKINPGDIVGLIGPNGAGKTTIMKTILGLTNFTGNITLNKKIITENNHKALSNVGALIEHPAIYPFLTGTQNLVLYSHNRNDLKQIISKLGMDEYIDCKAKGYSLGMKQKLGIAIALLNNPNLVILDEPMNGLDVESTICVRKLIQEYAQNGTAFLISSHILSELQKVMTQIILINQGQIVINQPISEFNKTNQQNYKLITENTNISAQILKENRIDFSLDENQFNIKRKNIFKTQDALLENQIHIQELSPIETNFEQIILRLLKNQKGNKNETKSN